MCNARNLMQHPFRRHVKLWAPTPTHTPAHKERKNPHNQRRQLLNMPGAQRRWLEGDTGVLGKPSALMPFQPSVGTTDPLNSHGSRKTAMRRRRPPVTGVSEAANT
ncbi:uncharacterized protein LOC127011552 [Drosophila biarmipes]|uniref:uncharacterized protein LOC127011552 n=1 Tax=Drosophila biarmipes TaxID=125945 RepID=UPI0021CCA074|nr:uncharacterized protein LOC127011552 [Drosophila biarmipes]